MRIVEKSKTRINILHVAFGLGGGIGRFLQILPAVEAKNEDLKVALLLRQLQGPYYEKLRDTDLKILASSNFLQTVKIMKCFDIIMFHTLNFDLFVAGILSRRKLVYVLHGQRLRTKRVKEVLRTWRISAKGIKRIVKRKIFSIFLKRFIQVCIVSTVFLRNVSQKLYGIPAEKIKIIPNGLDFSQIRVTENVRKALGIPPNSFVVGTAARLVEVKRIDRLIKAFGEFIKEDGEKVGFLLIVGDGSLRDPLERLVRELGLRKRVFFSGFRENVYDYIKAMDVFVLPSEGEACSLALLEAQYLGKPVIVFSDGGGALEVIRPGESGFVVKDEAELKTKLDIFCKNKELVKKMGYKASHFMKNHYSIERMAQQYKDVYYSLQVRNGERM